MIYDSLVIVNVVGSAIKKMQNAIAQHASNHSIRNVCRANISRSIGYAQNVDILNKKVTHLTPGNSYTNLCPHISSYNSFVIQNLSLANDLNEMLEIVVRNLEFNDRIENDLLPIVMMLTKRDVSQLTSNFVSQIDSIKENLKKKHYRSAHQFTLNIKTIVYNFFIALGMF